MQGRVAAFYAAVRRIMIALDLAKNAFQIHGAMGWAVVTRNRVRRDKCLSA
ncbi:msr8685 [Mesorhizobium japonicum MAFF 303099]|uniref:Msr8685 protein n=1 Tax=Mesorhizobium japonicum (strain LMG 29417 / CECT 9101 / MAFF 303099) TaxID=266835 RepID=Q98AC6_RHILO|nr:msr8685 [Mesorhizobium japonicum MAFF 303099]